jgi:hypothetical protein
MAIFSGKIIEAYFTNKENTTIEIIYKDGEKAISHYMQVDYDHPDFQALIKEYPVNLIETATIERNKQTVNQLRTAVKQAQQTSLKQADDTVNKILDFVLNYDPKKDSEKLFAIKIKIFDDPLIKDFKDNEMKAKVRMAKTPIETLSAYNDILKQIN